MSLFHCYITATCFSSLERKDPFPSFLPFIEKSLPVVSFPPRSCFSLLSQHEADLLNLPLLPICHNVRGWTEERCVLPLVLVGLTCRASRMEELQPLEETPWCLSSRHCIPHGFSKSPWLFHLFFSFSPKDKLLNYLWDLLKINVL